MRPDSDLLRRGLAILLGTLAVLSIPDTAGAQILGRVTDRATELPVPSAGVALIDSAGTVFGQAVTNQEGLFAANIQEEGSYTVQVVAMGYVASGDNTADFRGDRIFLEIGLQPAPLETEGIVVEVESRVPFLEMGGFYDRMKAGNGTFLTPEYIRERRAVRTSHLLRGVSGVVVSGNLEPILARTLGTTPGEGECVPNIYVDGQPLRRGNALDGNRDPLRFENLVPPPEQVSAMEVYPGGASIPPQWRTGTSGCGVIVIWSRRW